MSLLDSWAEIAEPLVCCIETIYQAEDIPGRTQKKLVEIRGAQSLMIGSTLDLAGLLRSLKV